MGLTTFRPGQRRYIPGVRVVTPYHATSFTGVLDGITTAAAYGLRQLRSAYSGSAVRVRRSSDSTEQDIGFVSGEFDNTSFTTFVGGGSGFVKTWYDQSGNARDATQTSTGKQPQVILSGLNSKPSLDFVAANNSRFDIATGLFYRPVTIFQVVRFDVFGDADSKPVIMANITSFTLVAVDGANSKLEYFNGSWRKDSNTIATGNGYIVNLVGNASQTRIGANGTLTTVASAISATTGSTVEIGYRSDAPNSPFAFDGYMTELIIASSELSNANINTIGSNQAARFGLSWTTVT